MSKPEPNWQPISQLPLFVSMIRGILENTEDQYQTFLEVADKPHVLDDATVQRAQRLYRVQLEDMDLYEAQAKRWLQEPLTTQQQSNVAALYKQVSRIRDLSQKILTLLSKIEKGTINRVMAMSDEDLGREYLRRTQKKKKPKKSNMQKRTRATNAGSQNPTIPKQKHHQIARKIHEWVMDVHSRGGGQEELLTNMIDYMPSFKQMLDSATGEQINALCEQYPGFYEFAILLEDLAGAIRSGHIEVPDDLE